MDDTENGVVLVVDDEPELCEIIAFDIESAGFNTISTQSVKSAMEIISKQKIDAIVSDIRMVDGSGLELLNNRNFVDKSRPAVIFISGFTEVSLEDAYVKGAEAIFTKPFDPEALLATLKNAIAAKREGWARRLSRTQANFVLQFSTNTSSETVVGKVANIGLGGMFVNANNVFPAVGTIASFKIQSDQFNQIEIPGTIRWHRRTPTAELLAGFGVEFDLENRHIRRTLVELLNRLRTGNSA